MGRQEAANGTVGTGCSGIPILPLFQPGWNGRRPTDTFPPLALLQGAVRLYWNGNGIK